MISSELPLWISVKEVTTVCFQVPFPKEEVVDLMKGEAQAIFKELCAQETFCGGSQSSWNSRMWVVVYIFLQTGWGQVKCSGGCRRLCLPSSILGSASHQQTLVFSSSSDDTLWERYA